MIIVTGVFVEWVWLWLPQCKPSHADSHSERHEGVTGGAAGGAAASSAVLAVPTAEDALSEASNAAFLWAASVSEKALILSVLDARGFVDVPVIALRNALAFSASPAPIKPWLLTTLFGSLILTKLLVFSKVFNNELYPKMSC